MCTSPVGVKIRNCYKLYTCIDVCAPRLTATSLLPSFSYYYSSQNSQYAIWGHVIAGCPVKSFWRPAKICSGPGTIPKTWMSCLKNTAVIGHCLKLLRMSSSHLLTSSASPQFSFPHGRYYRTLSLLLILFRHPRAPSAIMTCSRCFNLQWRSLGAVSCYARGWYILQCPSRIMSQNLHVQQKLCAQWQVLNV